MPYADFESLFFFLCKMLNERQVEEGYVRPTDTPNAQYQEFKTLYFHLSSKAADKLCNLE
jgi:hypothetical protein